MRSIEYEQYLVKLLFNCGTKEKSEMLYGSGIIVKPFEFSDYLYIFTAKHTFEKEVRDKDYPNKKEMILFDDEYIKSNLKIEQLLLHNNVYDKYNCTSELYPSYVNTITNIIKLEDKELDLIIIEMCIKDIEVCVSPLCIDKSSFEKVVAAGFPNIRDGLPYGYNAGFDRHYDETKIHFEIESKKNLFTKDVDEYTAIKGMSGGGVFIQKDEHIYLVGIIIEYQKPKGFKCIDLRTIYRSIDSILKSRTELISRPIDLDNGKSFDIEMVKVDLDDEKNYVGIYPVTFEEYDLFCEDIGKKEKQPSSEGFGRGKNPVINVSWNDAIEYCLWLSTKDTYTYTLLSLNDRDSISKNTIVEEEDIWHNEKEIIAVDDLNPNALGLYHFYGNVNEWCSDNSETFRIATGGSYKSSKKNLNREIKKLPSIPSSQIGFRIRQIVTENIIKS